MAKTIEQYMSKTRADYGLGIAWPKIKDKDSFELKGQFLKELHDNTFSGLDHKDANEHIEKVLKIMDLFHIPNITIDQVMLRAFLMSLTEAASRLLRNKPSGLITTWEDLKTKFLSKYCLPAHVPTRKILDSRGATPSKIDADTKVAIQEMAEYSQNGTMEHHGPEDVNNVKVPTIPKIVHLKKGKPSKKLTTLNLVHLFKEGGYRAAASRFYQRNNINPSYQEQRQSMEDTLSKFMSELAKRHEENSNLIKEIRASTDATIRNQGAQLKLYRFKSGK
nr:hypothetical protein [Tanacetum cinerariifolium]